MQTLLASAASLFMAGACVSGVSPTAYEHNRHDADHSSPHVARAQSDVDFATTLAQLQAAIDTRGFKTFAVIDHAAGAASVDMMLRPTTLIIFGNPQGGAPVMAAEQLMGIELPLKMLVAEAEDGSVTLTWRHGAHLP
ncbi:MAG: DUF302 domain-containing protein [Pseudomonadota bacterium]